MGLERKNNYEFSEKILHVRELGPIDKSHSEVEKRVRFKEIKREKI